MTTLERPLRIILPIALGCAPSCGDASTASPQAATTGGSESSTGTASPFTTGAHNDDTSSGSSSTTDGSEAGGGDSSGGAPPSVPAWNAFVGAHYAPRSWARGGLRDPGGAHIGYAASADGSDGGWAAFERGAIPALAVLLADGQAASIAVGGAEDGAAFFDSMQTAAGREAFAQALAARVDAIAALPDVTGWEQRVVFQFGNEIQNPQRFLGAVCEWATAGATTTCDFAEEFTPAYVEYYLAPGAEALREHAELTFGEPDAIRIGLGSIVNLVTHRELVDTLLDYRIVGDAAPSLAGMRVADVVDTVTIHYTMAAPGAVDAVDSLYEQWIVDPDTAVRALWMTEEVGAQAAGAGFGMAAALRSIAPTLRWWSDHGIDPADGHMFLWGADIGCADLDPTCLSVDDAMPVFAEFADDRPLEAVSDVDVTADGELDVYGWAAGEDRRIVMAWPRADATVTLSHVALDVSGWGDATVDASAYVVGAHGLPEVSITADENGFAVQAPLVGHEVLLLLIAAQP